MVNVNRISSFSFISIGFISKDQALKAYKGIKSIPKETEDNYLKRTYFMIKHVIYENKINDLIEEEENIRHAIEVSFNLDYQIIRKNEYEKISFINKYIKIINYLKKENEMLKDEIECINEENEYLKEENSNLSISVTKNVNLNKIMNLSTKKINQCHNCAICNEIIVKKETIYNLCHLFHIRCLTFWLLDNTSCPCCRRDII